MTRPEYGKPETWPRVPAEWRIFNAAPRIRRTGILPRYVVSIPDPKVRGMSWLCVVWGYKRAQRVLDGGD